MHIGFYQHISRMPTVSHICKISCYTKRYQEWIICPFVKISYKKFIHVLSNAGLRIYLMLLDGSSSQLYDDYRNSLSNIFLHRFFRRFSSTYLLQESLKEYNPICITRCHHHVLNNHQHLYGGLKVNQKIPNRLVWCKWNISPTEQNHQLLVVRKHQFQDGVHGVQLCDKKDSVTDTSLEILGKL